MTNKDYVVGTAVLFYSILKNSNVDHFLFHVIYDKDSVDKIYIEWILEDVARDAKTNKKFKLAFSHVSFEDLEEFEGNTIEFYKKALAKFVVFGLAQYDKLLFLDSDMLVLGDISELFEIEEDFAACIDMGTPEEFNTGLMFIKNKWLDRKNVDKLFDYSKDNFSYRGDQEHINKLINGNLKILPSQYNTLKDQHRNVGSWLANVKILHYISKKPWTPYHPTHHKAGNLECLEIDKLWFKYFNELELLKMEYSFLKNRIELIKHISKKYPDGVGVEVGVQKGEYSKAILENWDCRKLYLVDPWEEYDEYSEDWGAISQQGHEQNLEITKKNIEQYKNKVQIIKDYSVSAAELFNEKSLDFVYLDARHDKEGIKEDIEAWWPLIKEGGIIAGHDYTDFSQPHNKIEVKEVVDEFFEDYGRVNYTLDGPYPSWWIEKNEEDS